jgi:hypothetical protein
MMPEGDLLTIVIPVVDRVGDVAAVYRDYRSCLHGTGVELEFLFVFDGPNEPAELEVAAIEATEVNVRSITLPYRYGEGTCLRTGELHARGAIILALPPYRQIATHAIPSMLRELDGADLVSVARDRAGNGMRNRVRQRFLRALSGIAGSEQDDLGCGVRLFRRGLLAELDLRADQHRFLPGLAERAGFTVRRVVLPQAEEDQGKRWHTPASYAARVLDTIAMACLLRFTQKPFRLFGPIGAFLAVIGLLVGMLLSGEKLLYGTSLADRPALLLSVVLIVLGVQILAIGLIAEMVVMTRFRDLPTYRVDRIVGKTDQTMRSPSEREPTA